MQKAKKGIISVFEKPKATAQQKLVEYVKRSFPKIDVELDKNKFNEFVGDFKNKKLLNAKQEVFGVVDSKTGKIYLKPTKALEFIDIEFFITPTGASFENI